MLGQAGALVIKVVEICAAEADAVAGVVAFKHLAAVQAATLTSAVIFSGIVASIRRGAGHRVSPPANQKSRPYRGRLIQACYLP